MLTPSQLLMEADTVDGADAWIRLARTFLRHMHPATAHLPIAGLAALRTATDEWADTPRAGLLLEAKTQRWQFLNDKHAGSNIILDNEDRAMRALLCCLDEVPDTNAAEYAEWFCTMINAMSGAR